MWDTLIFTLSFCYSYTVEANNTIPVSSVTFCANILRTSHHQQEHSEMSEWVSRNRTCIQRMRVYDVYPLTQNLMFHFSFPFYGLDRFSTYVNSFSIQILDIHVACLGFWVRILNDRKRPTHWCVLKVANLTWLLVIEKIDRDVVGLGRDTEIIMKWHMTYGIQRKWIHLHIFQCPFPGHVDFSTLGI